MTHAKRMVTPGHMLDDTDIEILLSCYRKMHGMKTPENIAVTPAVCDTNSSPFQTVMNANWNTIQGTSYPRKLALPLRIPGFAHWNVIEITQDDEHNIFCRQFDTNGYSYPVRPRELREIRGFFNQKIPNCEIRTQVEKSKQVYSFGLQHDDNCGIVTTCIINDIETNRIPHHTENRILNNYGGHIEKHQRKASRSIMKDLVIDYGNEIQKRNYCSIRGEGGVEISGSSYRAGGRFKYNSEDNDQKTIYEGFQKNKETLVSIIQLINEHPDEDGEILKAIRADASLYDSAKFIFENHKSEDEKVKDGWMNIAILVLKERLEKDSQFADRVNFIFADNNPEGEFKAYWKTHFTKTPPLSVSDDLDSMDVIIVLLLALVIGALIPAKTIAIVVATVLAIAAVFIALDWFMEDPKSPTPSGRPTPPSGTAPKGTNTGPRKAADFKPENRSDSEMNPDSTSTEETKGPSPLSDDSSGDEAYEDATNHEYGNSL